MTWTFIGLRRYNLADFMITKNKLPTLRNRFTLMSGSETEMRQFFEMNREHTQDLVIGELYDDKLNLVARYDIPWTALIAETQETAPLMVVASGVGERLLAPELINHLRLP